MKRSCCIEFLLLAFRYVVGPLVLLPFIILVAPLYRIWDGFIFLWFQGRHIITPAQHAAKVRRVQEQVRAWNAGGRKARMCSARPAWATPTVHSLDKRNLCRINLQDLDQVLELDTANGLVTVEPGMMIGRLTGILNPRGWTVPVVPEIEALTVGGLICGAGLESSSTQWSMPGYAAVEFEVVLSSGEVVTCSAEKNADLFHSIPWSHGTLGFLTAAKFPLLPAKKYVRLEYHVPVNDDETLALLDSREHEFVEGFSYGRHKFVVMHGDMADHDPRVGRVNSINRWYKPFFYQHAMGFLGRRSKKGTGPVAVEFIPLRDYYHRHTRGYFWGMQILLPPFCTRLFLIFFGWVFPMVDARIGKAAVLPFIQYGGYGVAWRVVNVGQDFVIPIKHLKESLDFVHELTGVYPLWFCPCKMYRRPGMAHSKDPDKEEEMFVDIGIYGNVSKEAYPKYHPQRTLEALEAFTIEKGGFQGTYADMFLTRDQFRTMFDMRLYDEVRVKYGAIDAFPDVYDKVSKDARKIEVLV